MVTRSGRPNQGRWLTNQAIHRTIETANPQVSAGAISGYICPIVPARGCIDGLTLPGFVRVQACQTSLCYCIVENLRGVTVTDLTRRVDPAQIPASQEH